MKTIQRVVLLLFAASVAFSQSTTLKLPTATNTSDFTVTDSSNTVLMKILGDKGFYLAGTPGSGSIPVSGSGTRLMWYPNKSAFRAGAVSADQWDDANIGPASVAFGTDTKASGDYSTAMGYATTASGIYSTAMGYLTTASGNSSTAMGSQTTASGDYSTAMGYQTTASGNSIAMGYGATASGIRSTAMGFVTTASGDYSTAMGTYTTASNFYSTAMGYQTTASGEFSTAMGSYVSTTHEGSFIIGDASTTNVTYSSRFHEMTMRFKGGYRLFTNSNANVGAVLDPGASSWSSISDSTKKTNFRPADGEYFLSSLSKLRLGSWNYKTQDPKQFRHYGPMAQEIFHYFGHDGIGTIGNDTTLATADMDGIIMICLQALEKKVREQMSVINRLKARLEKLEATLVRFEDKKVATLEVSK